MIRQAIHFCLYASLFFSSSLYAFADLYTGTLSLEQDQLRLTRCSTGSPVYELVDADVEDVVLLEQLPAEVQDAILDGGISVQANVFGHYVEQEGVSMFGKGPHRLGVTRIENIVIDRSCHL